MEIFYAILLTALAVALFWGRSALRKKLDEEWKTNPVVPEPNGNGKHLALRTINGIGFTFYGDFRHANLGGKPSYATYYAFTFFFIPLFYIRCYRVVPAGDSSYYILGSENTSFREILFIILGALRWIAAIVAAFAIFIAFVCNF